MKNYQNLIDNIFTMTPTTNTQSSLISFEYLLIENYKQLSLTESDVTLILMINHFLGQNNKFINAEVLTLKMAMPKEEIDDRLANLMNKGYISYKKTINGMETSIQPLIDKLLDIFKIQMAEEQEFNVNSSKESNLKSLILIFQTSFGRNLSPFEITLLKEWLQKGFSFENITNAMQDSLNKGRKNFSNIYNLMIEKEKSKDIKTEGFSARNEVWNKNIQETIEIAKAKWNSNES